MLQEEERERRMDFVPEESAVNTEIIEARFTCVDFRITASDVLQHTQHDNIMRQC